MVRIIWGGPINFWEVRLERYGALKEYLAGLEVDSLDVEGVIQILCESIESGQQKVVHFLNPHSVVRSLHDSEFRSALKAADLVLPDGIGIILGSWLAGGKVRGRVHGPQVLMEFTRHINALNKPWKYFFLGSTWRVLNKICQRMHGEFPQVKVAGAYSPPFGKFGDEVNQQILNLIAAASPDILWVGMTAPKQEKWIYENRAQLETSVIAGIGAAFDLFAGTIRVPPDYIMKSGFYWLYRMVFEPKRLWRRNIVSGPQFFLEVFRKRNENRKFRRSALK